MREFTTAVNAELVNGKRKSEDSDLPELHTKIDGREITLQPITPSQMALVMYAVTSGNLSENIAALLNTFFGMLSEADYAHFKARLWDRSDPFDVEVVSEILKESVAEWSGKASPSSPDSSPLPTPTG